MDPIAALLGLDVDLDDEKTRALADSLRGRKRAADFFSVSSIDPIAKMAQTEGKSVEDSAAQAGMLRRAMAERAQQQSMQDERIGAQRSAEELRRQQELIDQATVRRQSLSDRNYGEDSAKYTQFVNLADPSKIIHARPQRGEWITSQDAPMDFDNVMELDAYKTLMTASKGKGSYEQPSTRAEREDFDKGDTDALALRQLATGWSEEFLPMKGTGPVKGGDIRNFFASYLPMLTDKGSEEGARWWKNYQRQAELVQRHEMFGSALTKSEQAAWVKANIDPNIANAETIRENLKIRADLAAKMAERQAFMAMKKGYDPEAVEVSYGSTVNVPEMFADQGASYLERLRKRQELDRQIGTGTDAASMPDLPIAPTGDYSDEEEQRYQELKARQAAGEL